MNPHHSDSNQRANQVSDTWADIEALVQQVVAISDGRVARSDFEQQLVAAAIQSVGGVGGAWWDDVDGSPRRRCQWTYESDGIEENTELIQHVMLSGQPRISCAEGTDTWLRLLQPILVDDRIEVLEVVQRPIKDPELQTGYQQTVGLFAELAGRHPDDDVSGQGNWQLFLDALWSDLDLAKVAYTIANDGRTLLGCDRVTVMVPDRRGMRMIAMSGVEQVNRNADSVREATQLAELIAQTGDVWCWPEDESWTAEMDETVQRYLDLAHATQIQCIPLLRPGNLQSLSGVLLVESFGDPTADLRKSEQGSLFIHQSALALHHAQSLQHNQLARLGQWWQRRTRAFPSPWKTIIALVVLAGLLSVALMPVDFKIQASGTLQPEHRQRIFAPDTAVVHEVMVRHGEIVAQDQLLLKMRDDKLNLDRARVDGEIATLDKERKAIQATRLQMAPATTAEKEEFDRLTTKEEQLQRRIDELQHEVRILEEVSNTLQVNSPMAGQVLTWEVDDQLKQRPVDRGDLLMTIADTNGPWQLELEVSDRDIGYVLKAYEDRRTLRVDYFLPMQPERTRSGSIRRIGVSARTDADQQLTSVPVIIEVGGKQGDRRAGASVVARIDCGKRPLAYVWSRRLIDTLRARWF